MTTLIGLSGSLRAASTNTKLMRAAAASFRADGYLEGDLRLPLYDGDLEDAKGIPPEVQTLADQIASADALLIVTPEYNKALSGVLKNAFDWLSRTKTKPFAGKPTAIMSATAGRSGGERAQTTLRLCLLPFQPLMIPGPEVLVASSHSAFDDNGALISERYQSQVDILMATLRSAT